MGRTIRTATSASRRSRSSLRFDSDLAQLAAVRAGLGIGVAQVPIAARDSNLRRVVPGLTLPLETWVVMHEDLRGVPRIRLVFDHLAEHLGRYLGALAPEARASRRR